MRTLSNRNYMVVMMSAVPANSKQNIGLALLYPSDCK